MPESSWNSHRVLSERRSLGVTAVVAEMRQSSELRPMISFTDPCPVVSEVATVGNGSSANLRGVASRARSDGSSK